MQHIREEILKLLKEQRNMFAPINKMHRVLSEAIAIIAHNTKLIVFDMDDVMWNLNKHVAELTGIPYEKMNVFSVYDNPNITEEEKEKILSAYLDVDTFKNIAFNDKIIGLINGIYNNCPDCTVQIISNCTSEAVRDVKMEQLLTVLDVPEENIHLHVINMETESLRKELPENIYLLVDDSPHNMYASSALYRVMPAKPYNKSVNGQTIVRTAKDGGRILRPRTQEELECIVSSIL